MFVFGAVQKRVKLVDLEDAAKYVFVCKIGFDMAENEPSKVWVMDMNEPTTTPPHHPGINIYEICSFR